MAVHTLLAILLERGAARRPLVGAHRGASGRAPENTLRAFRAALDDGAELIELDVRLTRDEQLAVIHDADARRVTGADATVVGATMDQLRRLVVGPAMHQPPGDRGVPRSRGRPLGHEGIPVVAGQPRDDVGIPELGDVFALARGRAAVNVEIKAGVPAVATVARRIGDYDMAGSVVVSSFDPAVVAAAADHGLLAGVLVEQLPRDPVATARQVGAALLHVKHTALQRNAVDRLHAAGLGVVAWTVDGPEEMRRLAALGVDAILSDDPRLLGATIG